MTVSQDPPLVDMDGILDEQETAGHRVTGLQWLLVVAGGVVGLAGVLALIAFTAPAIVDLIGFIAAPRGAVTVAAASPEGAGLDGRR